MSTIVKVVKFELSDMVRNKWIILYSVFFLTVTDLLFRFGGDSSQVIVSLMNIVLIFIPMISIIFGIIYLYNSREFIELLLAQPVNRRKLYFGMYSGMVFPLCSGFSLGVILPVYIHGGWTEGNLGIWMILIAAGVILNLIFTSFAFLITFKYDDKVKGLGISILLWLLFTVIYDGIILVAVWLLRDYPLEKIVIFLSLLNPVDLARILLLLQLDISALMGYTGAVFHKFFSGITGIAITLSTLLIWIALPFLMGLKLFSKKDF